MKDARRTQAERSAATRGALVDAGRSLFAARGFADVGTQEIVRLAGVTRGALYHHFADKTELFAAVYQAVEVDLLQRIGAAVAGAALADPLAVMRLGASTWLDACAEPEVHRIALIEAPAVLGWARWREMGARYDMGLVQAVLTVAVEAGRVPRQPIAPLAHVMLGALREAALYLADADDRNQARQDVGAVIDRLVSSLASGPAGPGSVSA